MSKLIYFTFFLSAFLLNCNSKNSSEKKDKPLEFYKASELAMLMRQMEAQSNIWKNELEIDTFNFSNNITFENIKTAKETKGMIQDKAVYLEYADNYLQTIAELKAAKTLKNKKSIYNSSIDACISCHKVYCQGPIELIKKLYVKE